MNNKVMITKDSKILYRFLDIAKNVIKEREIEYIIVNSGQRLCFYSTYVSAEIRLNGGMDNLNLILDLDQGMYKLRSTPVGSYELVKIGFKEKVNASLCFDINALVSRCSFGARIAKNDGYKISTITTTTRIPFPDNDIKLINKFTEFDVKYLPHDQILVFIAWDKEDEDLYQTTLVFNLTDDAAFNVQTVMDFSEASESEELSSVVAEDTSEVEEDDFYMPGME